MKKSRLAVIVYPLIIWLLAQSFFIWPSLFYFSVITAVLVTVFLAFLLKKPEIRKPWWFFAVLPVLFLLAIFIYSSLQINWLFIQFLFFILAVFLFSYYKEVYYLANRFDLYDEAHQTTLTAYGSFLTIFFLAANLYGLQSFLNLTVWPMFIIFALAILVINYFNLETEEGESKSIWQFSVIGTFILLELALVLVFLPLNYNVAAAVLGIIYYLFISLNKLYLQKALSAKKIKLYLIISYVGLALVTLSARWLN